VLRLTLAMLLFVAGLLVTSAPVAAVAPPAAVDARSAETCLSEAARFPGTGGGQWNPRIDPAGSTIESTLKWRSAPATCAPALHVRGVTSTPAVPPSPPRAPAAPAHLRHTPLLI
jgi:hypothetical protein